MRRRLLLGGLVFAAVLAWTAGASAAVSLWVVPEFPVSGTIHDEGIVAHLRIINKSTGDDATGPVTVSDIRLLPYCDVESRVAVTCQGRDGSGDDPGVLSVASPAIGESGTGCPDTAFDVAVSDQATGAVTLTPDAPITLNAPDQDGSTCLIDLALTLHREPLLFDSFLSDMYTWPGAQATATATATNSSSTSSGIGNEMALKRLTPQITTTAQPTALAPADLTDSVEVRGVAGAPAPTGSIAWEVIGPADELCDGPHYTLAPTPVTGDGTYLSTMHAYGTGTFQWVASYSGDRNYEAAMGSCGDAGQTSVVDGPTFAFSIVTPNPYTGEIAGAALLDGNNPTGVVAFKLYGPDDPHCTSVPIFSSTATVPGRLAPTVESDLYSPPNPGTYHWTAEYSGDASNRSRTLDCSAPNSAQVIPVSPSLKFAPMYVVIAPGATQSAVVRLGGIVHPTGTLTFSLYGPWDRTCAAAPIFTTSVPVHGNDTYTSPPATAALSGVYVWVAHYSGDATSGPLTTSCDAQGDDFDAIRTSDFAIASTTVARDHSITMTIADHSYGSLVGTATFVETTKRTTGHGKHRHTTTRHKTVTFGKASVTVAGVAGALTIKPSAAARAALKKVKHLAVTATLQFTGREATAKRHRASVAVRR